MRTVLNFTQFTFGNMNPVVRPTRGLNLRKSCAVKPVGSSSLVRLICLYM